MLRVLILILILLLCSVGYGDQYEITSLPFTASSAYNYDTLTIQGTKLSSDSSGIWIQGHDILLDLTGAGSMGDTIKFAVTTGGDNWGEGIVYGIRLSGYNITIKGGVIIHAAYGTADTYGDPNDTTGDTTCCVFLCGGHDITCEDLYLYPAGNDCVGWKSCSPAGNGHYHVEYSGGGGQSRVKEYASRCAYTGTYMQFGGARPVNLDTMTSVSDKWIYNIHGVVADSLSSGGITVSAGYGSHAYTDVVFTCYVWGCTLSMDGRNERFTYPSGNGCFGHANGYGISMSEVCGGSYIRDNKIVAGDNWSGGRGILVGYMWGTSADSMIAIANNYIDVHEGPCSYLGLGNTSQAIRARWGLRYLRIDSNTVYITTGQEVWHDSTWEYGWPSVVNNGVCIRIQCCIDGADYTEVVDTMIKVRSNYCWAIAHADTASARAFIYEGVDAKTIGGIEFGGNVWKSGDNIFAFGGTNCFTADSLVIEGDTFRGDTLTCTGHYVWDIDGNTSDHMVGHRALDCVFDSGAHDSSVYLNVGVGYNGDIRLEKTLSMFATDNNDSSLADVILCCLDKNNNEQWRDTTNINGLGGKETWYHWLSEDYTDTLYGNFTLWYIYESDTVKKTNYYASCTTYADTGKFTGVTQGSATDKYLRIYR